MARPLGDRDKPIELARNPSWRRRMAHVRRGHVIAAALQRERRRGIRDALASVLIGIAAAAAAALVIGYC